MEIFNGFYGQFYQHMSQFLTEDSFVIQPGQSMDFSYEGFCQKYNRYAPDNEKHWEFYALGLVSFMHLGTDLMASADTKKQLMQTLDFVVSKTNQKHRALNWRLMKTISQNYLMGKSLITQKDLEDIDFLKLVTDSGLIYDLPGVVSTQYHAYIVHLLIFSTIVDPTCLALLKPFIDKGVEWLVTQYNQQYDINALGRGQFQLFGYVSSYFIAKYVITQQKLGYIKGVVEFCKQAIANLDGKEHQSALLDWKFSSPIRRQFLQKYNPSKDYSYFCNYWKMYADILFGPHSSQTFKPVLSGYLQTITTHGHLMIWHNQQGSFLVTSPCVARSFEAKIGKKRQITQAVEQLKQTVANLLKDKKEELYHPSTLLKQEKGVYTANHNQWSFEIDPAGLALTLKFETSEPECVSDVIWVKESKLKNAKDILRQLAKNGLDIEQYQWEDPYIKSKWIGFSVRLVRQPSVVIKFDLTLN